MSDTTSERGLRKQRVGVVLSDKGDKTIIVLVSRKAAHPLYGKVVASNKKYHAHDENNEARTGDTVRIVETRPLSKLKHWRLLGIERRGED